MHVKPSHHIARKEKPIDRYRKNTNIQYTSTTSTVTQTNSHHDAINLIITSLHIKPNNLLPTPPLHLQQPLRNPPPLHHLSRNPHSSTTHARPQPNPRHRARTGNLDQRIGFGAEEFFELGEGEGMGGRGGEEDEEHMGG